MGDALPMAPSGAWNGRVTHTPDVFDKQRTDAPAGFFAWEAAGLDWLRGADGGPEVVAVVGDVADDATSIALARVRTAPATRAAARELGAALARMHAGGAPAFGAPPPGWSHPHGWIGRQELPLGHDPDLAWGSFYARLRLAPYLRAARDRGRFDAQDVRVVERVCTRLESGELDDGRLPARIHGDLWGGNVLHSPAGAVLIDPAAHGGHGETDLAMLALFGTEHLRDVEDAYADAAGLDARWRERTGLHQLHPLLVHAVSHGPSYAAHALEVARRYA